ALRKEKREAEASNKADSLTDGDSRGAKKRRKDAAGDALAENAEGRGEEMYSATLNQTNVGNNNNKFFVIQALGYNAEKLPLGKLSKSTILKVKLISGFGYDVLRRISEVIAQSDRKKLEELSGEFYTVIPHDFGFRKMRMFHFSRLVCEFVIDSPSKLKRKLEMVIPFFFKRTLVYFVESLAEIEIATKLLKDDSETQLLLLVHEQQVCVLLLRKHQLQVTCLEREFILLICSQRVQIIVVHQVNQGMGCCFYVRYMSDIEIIAFLVILFFSRGTTDDWKYVFSQVALGEMAELLAADYNADRLPKGKLRSTTLLLFARL
ncbi:hypothetical protein B296_00003541, partial [Ensete ventricosum]